MDFEIERYVMQSVSMIFNPLIYWSIALPIIMYIVARWRAHKENHPHDPHLGFKVALSFFRVTSFNFILAGLFLLVYGMMTDLPDPVQKPIFRTAFGLLVPSFAVWIAHFVAMAKTNTEEMPQVARMFAGLQLMQTGVAGFVALLYTFVVVFQEGDAGEAGRIGWSMTIVYVLAWAIQGLLFARVIATGAPPPGIAQFAQRPAPPGTAPPAGSSSSGPLY